jgi:hypothetical protein
MAALRFIALLPLISVLSLALGSVIGYTMFAPENAETKGSI